MTACIACEFPWAAISTVSKSEQPGVIICTDTRVTKGKDIVVPGAWAKQEQVARNIVVCYTSSNLAATATALASVVRTKSVRTIGIALKNVHKRKGGFTELLAVVWRGDGVPKVLELMPPEYEPRPRRGVLGIGDADILQSFREQFFEQPRPDLLHPMTDEARASLSQAIGRPVPPPRYTVNDAVTTVASAFVEAIRLCRKPTVEIPVQISRITDGRVTLSKLAVSADAGETWTQVSAGPHEATPYPPGPAVTRPYLARLTALQLFP